MLNGHELNASVDEQEQVILQVAAGDLDRPAFTTWVRDHTIEHKQARPGETATDQ